MAGGVGHDSRDDSNDSLHKHASSSSLSKGLTELSATRSMIAVKSLLGAAAASAYIWCVPHVVHSAQELAMAGGVGRLTARHLTVGNLRGCRATQVGSGSWALGSDVPATQSQSLSAACVASEEKGKDKWVACMASALILGPEHLCAQACLFLAEQQVALKLSTTDDVACSIAENCVRTCNYLRAVVLITLFYAYGYER